MKKMLFALPILSVFFAFSGCSNDDGENQGTKIEVTQNEIQGSWHNSSYSSYRHIIFDGNNYSYNIMDVDTEELTRREHGVYTIDGINITFSAEGEDSKLGVCEIYWENESRSHLHIYPIGSFIKAD